MDRTDSATPSVAVVIPARDSAPLLERCLESLVTGNCPDEVVVIDNGSTDATADVAGEHGVDLIRFGANCGFGAAVNAGTAATKAPFVFVLNVDTIVGPSCIASLAAVLGGDEGLGGVQPMILRSGSEPPVVYSAGQRLLSDGRAAEEGAGEEAGSTLLGAREIFGACGAASMLRRGMLEQLGGYDERYFAFYEDVDLNARAQLRGWRFRYVPEAVVWHVGAATWGTLPNAAGFNARLVARNRLATAIRVMPARSAGRVAYAELASLAISIPRGTFGPTISGKLAALRSLRRLLRERAAIHRDARRGALEHWFAQEGSWLGSSARARVRPTADPGRTP